MRNVIVTGGSRGLGLGIARKLADEGYRVIAIARTRRANSSRPWRKRSATNPGSFHFVPFDLAQIEDIAGLVKTVRRTSAPSTGW